MLEGGPFEGILQDVRLGRLQSNIIPSQVLCISIYQKTYDSSTAHSVTRSVRSRLQTVIVSDLQHPFDPFHCCCLILYRGGKTDKT